MKRIILTTAITLTAFAGAFAQKSADANLSVTINPLQTIEVLNPKVNLNYANTTDYSEGVESFQKDHLKIYSTGGFQVNVLASDLETADGTRSIEASGITVTADNGGSNPLDNMVSEGAVNLPTTGASPILSSTLGGVERTINITYKGAGGNDYINKFFKGVGETPSVYSTTVTYSIEAN